jgi:peroxiredoxin Q/BCP
MAAGRPGVGDPAPGFDLEGTGGRRFRLADFLGRPVVLVFYPEDNSPVCTLQLREYSTGLGAFDDLGVQLLGISPQDVQSHESFACSSDLKMPLLADPDKAVGTAYAILGPLDFYRRSVFVVDAEGIIGYARRSLTSLTYVSGADLRAQVRRITAPA